MTWEPPTPEHLTELHRDAALLVLDKPAGLPMHPSSRYLHGTVVGRLRQHYGEGFAAPVHRLDRETSGVVICARTPAAARHLGLAFQRGQVRKQYLAIVEGDPTTDELVVDAPLARGGSVVRIAMRVDPHEGKPACTHFQVERRFHRDHRPFALLRATPLTGRQHQIRAHLRHAGLPLVGDKIYGPDESFYDRFSRGCLEPSAWQRLGLPRHALHAARVTVTHPETGQPACYTAPLPSDLVEFLGFPA